MDQSYDTRRFDDASPRQKKKGQAPMFARTYRDEDDGQADDEDHAFMKQKER